MHFSHWTRPSLLFLVIHACWSVDVGRAAGVTFGTLTGEVKARAGETSNSRPVTQYAMADGSGSTGISANVIMGASFDNAASSVTPVLLNSRQFAFAALASSSTDTPTTPATPRADSSAMIVQPLTVDGVQRIVLASNFLVSGAASGPASAVVSLTNAAGSPLLRIDGAFENSAQQSTIYAAGNLLLTIRANSQSHAEGSAIVSIQNGSLLVTALADVNGDLAVNDADLAQWAAALGAPFSQSPSGDLDGTARADGLDFLLWQREFGDVSTANSAATAVPEPHSALLWAAAIAPFCRARRRNHPA